MKPWYRNDGAYQFRMSQTPRIDRIEARSVADADDLGDQSDEVGRYAADSLKDRRRVVDGLPNPPLERITGGRRADRMGI